MMSVSHRLTLLARRRKLYGRNLTLLGNVQQRGEGNASGHVFPGSERKGQGTRQKRAASSEEQASRRRRGLTDAQARARVWTLCLAALALAALTGPLVALLTPLAPASAPALNMVAAALAAALVGAYVALAVLLARAVLRVVRPRLDGRP